MGTQREKVVQEALKQEIGAITGTLQRFYNLLYEFGEQPSRDAALQQLNAEIQVLIPGVQVVFPETVWHLDRTQTGMREEG